MRSNAQSTSLDVISRLSGGPNLMPLLEVERVRLAAVRDHAGVGGEVRDDDVARGAGDVVVADERAHEQVRVDAERLAEVFTGRVEAVGEVERRLPLDAEHAAGLPPSSRGALLCCGRALAVVASDCQTCHRHGQHNGRESSVSHGSLLLGWGRGWP